MYECFVCMYVCVPQACLVPKEARRRHQILRNCGYRWLCTTAWLMGMEPGSSQGQQMLLTTDPPLQSLLLCLDREFMQPRLASHWICSWEWSWTPGSPVSTSWVLGLAVCMTVSSFLAVFSEVGTFVSQLLAFLFTITSSLSPSGTLQLSLLIKGKFYSFQ